MKTYKFVNKFDTKARNIPRILASSDDFAGQGLLRISIIPLTLFHTTSPTAAPNLVKSISKFNFSIPAIWGFHVWTDVVKVEHIAKLNIFYEFVISKMGTNMDQKLYVSPPKQVDHDKFHHN